MNVILFAFMYLISFHLVINSDDWFLVWLGLEINMMTFIVFMFRSNSLLSIESCMKYFFIQSLGSAALMGIFYLNKEWLDFVLCMLLSYKMGAGPFFFWFPSVCSGISWMSCFVLMSFQKVLPLMIMSLFVSWVFYILVLISLFLGVFGSFNQKDVKQLIAFSSVYHLGWILLCNMIDDVDWLMYLLIYSMMIFPVLNMFKWLSVSDLSMVMKMKYKVWLIIFMLSMAGMPPFLGFFLKWFAFIIIFKFEFMYMLFLIFCSVVMFYVYFRVVYDVLMSYYDIGVWGSLVMYNEEDKNFFDLVSVIGLTFGLFFCVFFLF